MRKTGDAIIPEGSKRTRRSVDRNIGGRGREKRNEIVARSIAIVAVQRIAARPETRSKRDHIAFDRGRRLPSERRDALIDRELGRIGDDKCAPLLRHQKA